MKKKSFLDYFKYIVINILAAAVVTLLLNNFVATPYKIKGHSMKSTLMDQERIIISKLSANFGTFQRFDIVVLHKPRDPKKSIIKRIIGLPGETIEIKTGDVYINQKQLPQPFLKKKKGLLDININMRPITIPKNHVFIMGDNRPVSRDSRSFGTVPLKYIYGKSVFRYWPFKRIGTTD